MNVKLIIIGGFLGSGKMTAILRLARCLVKRGHRVAIIAERPPYSLADSSLAHDDSLLVHEIPGGCVRCHLDFLEESIRNLSKREWPDIIIAAPMGSCVDLIAAVARPLISIYKTGIKFSPLSVMVDPINMLHTLGLESGRGFGPEVECIIRRQMIEAEKIVINKCDVFPPRDRKRVATAVADQFPSATVYSVSARTGQGCSRWFRSLLNEIPKREQVVALHNSNYAKLTELHGRFDGLVSVSGLNGKALDPEVILKRFAEATRAVLSRANVEVTHLKAILGPIHGWHLRNYKRSAPFAAKKRAEMLSTIMGYYLVRISGPKEPIIVRGYKCEELNQAHLTISLEGTAKPEVLGKGLSEAAKELADMALFTFEKGGFRGPTITSRKSSPTPFGRPTQRQ